MRPSLSRRFPLVDGPDELYALGLETPTGTLDVVHQETGDWSRAEVSVLGVGGAEDLRLAAVWQHEERELSLFVLEPEP
jgi:hypothetical protein